MLNRPPYCLDRRSAGLALPVLVAFMAGVVTSTPWRAMAQTSARQASASQTAASQTSASQASGAVVSTNEVIVTSQNCPVEFSAKRWGAGAVENARDGGSAVEERGLLLHFHAPGKDQGVVQATAIVRGSSYHAHVTPAGSSSADQLTQTFHLAEAERNGKGDWKLTTDQVPLVQEIDIVAIRFADGTTWKTSENASCRIQPDGLVLVANSR